MKYIYEGYNPIDKIGIMLIINTLRLFSGHNGALVYI
jgi:hypothetical protein